MHLSGLLFPVFLSPWQAIANPGPLQEIIKHGQMNTQICDFYLFTDCRIHTIKDTPTHQLWTQGSHKMIIISSTMIDYLRLLQKPKWHNRCQQTEHKPSLSLLWRLLDTWINNDVDGDDDSTVNANAESKIRIPEVYLTFQTKNNKQTNTF